MRCRPRFACVVAVAFVVVSMAGCVSSSERGADRMHGNVPLESASVTTKTPVTQEGTMLHESSTVVNGSEIGVIVTSKGTVKVEFFKDDAPNTVASFIELADSGFYDQIKFHRVVPRFVVQGGDPITRPLTPEDVRVGIGGIGTGGPGWNQKAEFNNRKHVTGTLAMARSQHPDSAGSQFYICLEPQPGLDGDYTVFGQVIEGMDVVSSIEVGDVIESITIER